ncbi:MAG TPA: D-glycero-beta-D-manno-heptose-7-phosphate kinase [Vicinamibacterales bacterium]|nr:D-glycero-beta-D-manno-heptose-7-phosphate kinase [Vicinamibacterales bacterium]
MTRSALQGARACEIVGRFASVEILVVGDLMLDQFVIGRVRRISPEAPVPVVEHDHDEHRIGGAGNVAHNIRALGARVALVGLVGTDAAADWLRAELAARGLDGAALVADPARPTTRKQRIVTTRNQQVARVDFESDAEAGGAVERALIDRALGRLEDAAAVVVSDYLKGAVTRALVAAVVERARARSIPVLVDPKVPHLDYYAGTTVVKPNLVEAEMAAHMRIRTDEDAGRAGRRFLERAGCRNVLITRGEHGMSVVTPAEEAHYPAVAREVADVTGAGDTVIGAVACALAAGADLAEAAQLANHAAGIVVGRFGPATISPADLLTEIEMGSDPAKRGQAQEFGA